MSNQKNVFNLAETVLFGKKGNTKAKRETIRANYLAIVAAFKDIRTLFMYRDAPCLKLLSEAKEGWRTAIMGSESSGVVVSNKVHTITVEKLALRKQTKTGFKITDWRLKGLWDAIVALKNITRKSALRATSAQASLLTGSMAIKVIRLLQLLRGQLGGA